MKQYQYWGSVLVIALSACGGGGGSDQQSETSDSSAPTVNTTTPVANATGISRSAAVSATFNEDLIASTVSNTSFSLVGTDPVDGVVAFDALTNVASFTPSQPLSLLTTYTATLNGDLTDLAGNALSAAYSWQFTTTDGTLSSTAAQVHSEDVLSLVKPKIAYLDNGSAIAVWRRMGLDPMTSTLKNQVWSNRYDADSGWESAALLQTDPDANGSDPALASNSNGDGIAVWSQDSSEIWARPYNSTSANWDTAERINSGADSAGGAKIAVDQNGNGIAVWVQREGGIFDIWANDYTAGTGWGSAEKIENSAGEAFEVQVAFDGNGNAIAVWSQHDGTQFSVYGNRYVVGSGWGDAALLETIDTGLPDHAASPQIAADNDGNAIVVWVHYDGTRRDLWSNRYDVSSGWGTAELLESHDEDAGLPVLDMNGSGTAIVVWAKYDTTTRVTNYLSKRYLPGAGWGPEETFNYSQESYYYTTVGIDESGNALFFWEYDDGDNGFIWFNRYSADGGWGTATELTSLGQDYGDFSPNVSVKSDGEGIVIFGGASTDSQSIGTRLFE